MSIQDLRSKFFVPLISLSRTEEIQKGKQLQLETIHQLKELLKQIDCDYYFTVIATGEEKLQQTVESTFQKLRKAYPLLSEDHFRIALYNSSRLTEELNSIDPDKLSQQEFSILINNLKSEITYRMTSKRSSLDTAPEFITDCKILANRFKSTKTELLALIQNYSLKFKSFFAKPDSRKINTEKETKLNNKIKRLSIAKFCDLTTTDKIFKYIRNFIKLIIKLTEKDNKLNIVDNKETKASLKSWAADISQIPNQSVLNDLPPLPEFLLQIHADAGLNDVRTLNQPSYFIEKSKVSGYQKMREQEAVIECLYSIDKFIKKAFENPISVNNDEYEIVKNELKIIIKLSKQEEVTEVLNSIKAFLDKVFEDPVLVNEEEYKFFINELTKIIKINKQKLFIEYLYSIENFIKKSFEKRTLINEDENELARNELTKIIQLMHTQAPRNSLFAGLYPHFTFDLEFDKSALVKFDLFNLQFDLTMDLTGDRPVIFFEFYPKNVKIWYQIFADDPLNLPVGTCDCTYKIAFRLRKEPAISTLEKITEYTEEGEKLEKLVESRPISFKYWELISTEVEIKNKKTNISHLDPNQIQVE